MNIEKLRTKDLIELYEQSFNSLDEIKKELFARLDGKQVGNVIVTLDNFVK